MNDKTKHLSNAALSVLAAAGMTLSITGVGPVFAQEAEDTTEPAPVTEQIPEETEEPGAGEETPAEETPAEETPEVPAEPETPAEPEAPVQEAETEEIPAEELTEEEQPVQDDAAAEEQAAVMALAANSTVDVSASLNGMISSVMDNAIPVDFQDDSKAGVDTDYTGKAVLNMDMQTLLTPAKAKFDSVIGMWPNAKLWPVQGPNGAAVITLTVTLPEGVNASFTGTSTENNQSPLISGITVSASGKTATVNLTLASMNYETFFSKLPEAGTVSVEIPYAGTAAKGDLLDGYAIAAVGSGQLYHRTGFGFPITVGIDLSQGLSDSFFTKGDKYTYVAGVVDDTITLSSSLKLNDDAQGTVSTLTVGEPFTLTGTLDVSAIKSTLNEKIDKYKDIITELSGVQITGADSEFTAHYDLPEGVEFSGNAADAVFAGSDFFEIRSVTAANGGLDVVMGLKDPASITSLEQLSQAATSGADQFTLTLNNMKVTDAIAKNTPVTISTEVTGDFKAVATFENGAQYDVTYNFTAPAATEGADQVQLRVLQAIPMDETITVPASLAINDLKAGEVYRTKTGEPFSLTGSIDTGSIKEKMESIIKDYEHASQSPASIPVDKANVSFTATFALPEGVEWKSGSDAVFSGSDAFKLDSLTQDGQTLTAVMSLSNPDSIKTLQDLVDIAAKAGDTLSLKVDGFSLKDGATNFQPFVINADIEGKMTAEATSSTGYLFAIDIDFVGDPKPTATVEAVVPQQIQETVTVPAHLTAGDAAEGTVYSTLPETPFALTGSLDVTPIKEKMKELVGDHGHATNDPASLPVSDADVEFTAVFHLPEGISWKEGSSAEFTGSDGFMLKSLTQNGQDLTAVLTLKDPSSIKTVEDLINVAENSADMLSLKVEGFTVNSTATKGETFTVKADIAGKMDATAKSSLGIPFEFDFTFNGENEPTAEIKALQAQTITGDIPVTVTAGAGENKVDHYATEAGKTFPVTSKLDLSSLKSELNDMMSKFEKPGESPADIPVTNPNLMFNAFFSLPEGLDWKDGSTAELLGSKDFKVVSVTKDGDRIKAVIALSDPDSIKNLQDLMNVAKEAEDSLELKINGFSVNASVPAGTTMNMPASVSGTLSADAVDAENSPVVIRYTLSGSGESAVDIYVKGEGKEPGQPGQPGKPGDNLKPGTTVKPAAPNKKPATAANAGAAMAAGALSFSALGAAVLAFFRKNRK